MLVAYTLAFLLATACSLLYAPLVRRQALRVGLVDRPDNNRKKQPSAVALGGGVVVYLSLFTVMLVTFGTARSFGLVFRVDWNDIAGFSLACTTVVLLGLVDDRFGLRGRHKLLGQALAACFLMWTGLLIKQLGLFGLQVELGLLSVPFTLFWLLGAMNAINLLDGIDGLASMLGLILTATIAVLSVMNGNTGIALIALVLAGSLLGFLRYNLPPARMYLGDTGSMLIGLMVGALAIRAMLKGPGTVLLAAPLAIWAIPILDSGAAILRRQLTGRTLFATDRGHLHHRLLEMLGSNTRVLMVVGACCVATSVGALVSVWRKNDGIALVICLAVVAMLVTSGAFGRVEFALLLSRLRGFFASFRHPTHIGGVPRQTSVRLQGNQKWEMLWETLTESAVKLRLLRLHLDVNAPGLHESYVATWEAQDARKEVDRSWRLEFPLSVGEIQVGRLDIRGGGDGGASLEELAQLLDLLEPFQQRLVAFTQPPAVAEPELAESVVIPH